MHKHPMFFDLPSLFRRRPQAFALLRGSNAYPMIRGRVRFYRTESGVIVCTEAVGLPAPQGSCEGAIFGFHIHGGSRCSGTDTEPFADAGSHYDPYHCSHPYHAGDLPPLFSAGGRVFSAFLTDRFSVREIIGKTVIIHGMPDDFTSQPAGNAGQRIACGEIRSVQP